jgi:hypothetical protein
MHSLFCKLPNCNLFTQHVIYLYGETPLVNCGPRFILLHIYYHLLQAPFTFRNHYLLTANKHLFPYDTFNPLFFSKPVRLTTSLQVGAKYLGCVVCRFQVAAGAGSAPGQKPVSINLHKWFLSPTGQLNFGFITEGKLTAVLITPSSWGSQLVRQHRTIRNLHNLIGGPKYLPQRPLSHPGFQEPKSNKLRNFHLPNLQGELKPDAPNAMARAHKVLKSFSPKFYQSNKCYGGI